MTKLQITITPEEKDIISAKAEQLGYNVTKYVKFLISREAAGSVDSYPAYQMRKKTKTLVEKAQFEHKKGETVELKNLDELDK